MKEILRKIVEISYLNDIRMITHIENPKKINNIVEGNEPYLREIYQPFIMMRTIPYTKFENDKLILQDYEKVKKQCIMNLPNTIHIENNKQPIKNLEKIIKKRNLKYSIYGVLSGLFSSDIHKGVY